MTFGYDSRRLNLEQALNVVYRLLNERLEGRTLYDWSQEKGPMPINEVALQNAIKFGGPVTATVNGASFDLDAENILQKLNMELSFYPRTPYVFGKKGARLYENGYQRRQDYMLVRKDTRERGESWRAPIYTMLTKMLESGKRCTFLSFIILNDYSIYVTTWNCPGMDLNELKTYFFISFLSCPMFDHLQDHHAADHWRPFVSIC